MEANRSSFEDKVSKSPGFTTQCSSFENKMPSSPQRPRVFHRSYSHETKISRSSIRNSVNLGGHSSFSDAQSIPKRPLSSLHQFSFTGRPSMQSSGGRPRLNHSRSLEESRSVVSQHFHQLSSSPISPMSSTLHRSVGTFNPISPVRTATRDLFFSSGIQQPTGSSHFVGRRLSSAGLSPRPLPSSRRLSIL